MAKYAFVYFCRSFKGFVFNNFERNIECRLSG